MATTLDSDPQGFVRSLFEEQKPEALGAMPRQQQNGALGAMAGVARQHLQRGLRRG